MSSQAASPSTRRKRSTWAIAALVTMAVVVAAIVGAPRLLGMSSGEAVTVATTTVGSGSLTVTASGDGQTEAIDSYEGYPQVSGTVEEIAVSVGDRVKAGEVLYTLDDGDLQQALTKATSSLRQADQQVAQAKQQVSQATLQLIQAENRLDALESRSGTMSASAAEIEEAEQSIEVAEDSLTSAKAGLASAKASRTTAAEERDDAAADVDTTEVTAPVAGTVTQVNISEGGAVSAGGGTSSGSSGASSSGSSAQTGATTGSGSGAPVVISDTSELKVTVVVNEVDIADVAVGQEATVTFDAVEGLEIPATVSWLSPNAEASGNVTGYRVELTLGEQDERLRTGMTASADIVTLSVADALLLPKSSIKTQDAEKYVTVVAADGTQERRTVTTGASDDTRVQVLTGVQAGDEVVSVTAADLTEQGGMPRGAMMLGGGAPPTGRPGSSAGQGGDR